MKKRERERVLLSRLYCVFAILCAKIQFGLYCVYPVSKAEFLDYPAFTLYSV